MRLIDADALEKDGWMMHRTIRVDKNTMEYQTKKPTKFPTVEPERKTGKWKYGVCSECEFSWADITLLHEVPNFCPNCGSYNGGDTNV